MNREKYLKDIVENLTILKTKIELLNSISYYDINITSEYFYSNLLNMIYGYKLTNANAITKNIKAIDLIDDENKISVQVTSDNSSNKIRETIKKFEESEQYKKYDRLIFLILTQKKKYKANFSSKYFKFNTENDIWDIKNICTFLKDKEVEFLKKIHEFLKKEIKNETNNDIIEANEVETIIALIEYISKTKAKNLIKHEVIIDPEYKITKRFKEFANSLIKKYQTLYLIYNETLNTVFQKLDIDEATITISQIFLQDISIKYLDEENENPLKALERLVEFFESKLLNHQRKYDQKAIEFYLVDQIIKCNVFPNLKEEYKCN